MKMKIASLIVCVLLLTTIVLPCTTGKASQGNSAPQADKSRSTPSLNANPQPSQTNGAPLVHESRSRPSFNTDWWPMFGHDLGSTRYSTSTAPDTSNVLWSYTTGGGIETSCAIQNGKAYVGAFNGKVYCLDATTGEFVWDYQTYGVLYSSPAVANGKVYIGCYNDKKVYCLDAATGTLIWTYTTGAPIGCSSPAVADGNVFIGSEDNKLYCLNASTGGFIWSYTTGAAVYSSPAIVNGKVYVGSYDGKVYCLNAATGGFIWSYTTGGPVYSSPAVVNGKVYVGSRDCKVYCLNATNGGLKWSHTTGDKVHSSPAVTGGKVYIGSDDGNVYCFNATTGGNIWHSSFDGWIFSSPSVADGKVLVGCYQNHTMYCLDAATGGIIWDYTTNGFIGWPSPAIVDGIVYIGSDDGTVYAFGEQRNLPPHFFSPTPANGSIGQPISLTWSIPINDSEGDLFCWSIECSNGQSAWGANETNGTKTLALTNLEYGTEYVVWVDATDPNGSGKYTTGGYWFSTRYDYEDYNYTINNGTATITGYKGPGGAITIPSTLGGYPTRHIGDYAFMSTHGHLITSVVIPSGVTTIGFFSFNGCTTLTSVTLPDTLKTIGVSAFYYCPSLTTVVIPNSVTTLSSGAFYSCTALVSVVIGDNVTDIGASAFNCCSSLASVTMGHRVDTIEEQAFRECSSLTSLDLPDSLITIGDNAFLDCTALNLMYLPWNLALIDDCSFRGCSSLTGITVIPDSVFRIGFAAFDGCGLTSIHISHNVGTIEDMTFHGCKSLTSVIIPNSVTSIGGGAFWGCTSLTSVRIPDSVLTFGDWGVFGGCTALTSVTLGRNLSGIGTMAFRDCANLTSISFLGSVAPEYARSMWIDGTPPELRGHALNTSNFPPPGGVWNGLTMGAAIVAVNTSAGSAIFRTENGTMTSLNWINVTSLSPEAIASKPVGLDLPFGLFSYIVTNLTPGQSIILRIELPGPVPIGSNWWKLSPTNTWYSLPIGDDDGDPIITINVTDGGTGDADGTTDGVIHDPGAVGIIPPTDWWPMFGHDLQHTRHSNSTTPDTCSFLWSYQTGSQVFSSPAVVDGNLYIGSRDGKVYCLDAVTGGLVWSYTTGGYVDSSPAVADGRVYVGSADCNVYCLDAATGAKIWNFPTDDVVWSGLAVAEGKVYVASQDYQLYCLDAVTGGLLWDRTVGVQWLPSSPAIAYGRVYIGGGDGQLHCLNATTGEFIWNYTTSGGDICSSPTVVDGKVYAGSSDVFCLDATNGNKLWDFALGEESYSSPAVAYDKVFMRSFNKGMYCLDEPTGGLIWSRTTGNGYDWSSPAVADTKVYYGSENHRVYCLDMATGWLIWNFTTGGAVDSSPAVANGYIYVGSDDGKVYAFGPQPPNQPPVFGVPNPPNGSIGQPTNLWWSIPINDPEGNHFSWTINCSNGQRSWGTNQANGTKSVWLSGLATGKQYTVWVNATDPNGSGLHTRAWYTFYTGYVDGDYIYHVSNGVAIIIGYTGAGGNITIPSTLGGHPTRYIGDYAFDSTQGHLITSAIIPSSVISIGIRGFGFCSSLTSVTIPSSVTTIGDDAFVECTSLTSVIIPDSVTTIGVGAFAWCWALTSVTLPHDITYLADELFIYCGNLPSVTIPDSVTVIGNNTFRCCYALTSLTIPDYVTTIGVCAFRWSGLTSMSLPNSVTRLGSGAFEGCDSLSSVNIPPSITTIEGWTFSDCTSLTSITIPSSVTSIEGYAFAGSGLTSAIIPNTVTLIGDGMFEFCSNLTSVTLGSTVMTIGNYTFYDSSVLTSITFLGLTAPTKVGTDWIFGTPPEIRGHALNTSNFPPSGENWNGLRMGTVIVVIDIPAGTTTFRTDNGTMTTLTWVNETSLPPEANASKPLGLTLPFGLFNYTVADLTPGQNINLTIELPGPVPIGSRWWKLSPTNTWFSLSIGDDDGDPIITINVTDGGFGDTDGTTDGVIHDPGGIGEPIPNLPPHYATPTPANGTMDTSRSLTWSIPINDPDGDPFSWTIHCSNGQTTTGTNEANGTKTLALTGLAYGTQYTVWVNATDPTGSGNTTRQWYTFTTKASLPPVLGSPTPANESTNQPLGLTWSIPINDPEGDTFSWTIQCSNGQQNSGTGAANGTKTLALSGLAYSTLYKVWVNATDPTGSGQYTRRWYSFTTKTSLPPTFGTPTPSNGSTNNPLSLTWSIPINDPEGDTFSWTIQCNNGQTNSGTNEHNGTKTLTLSGLTYSTTYKIWVNATDTSGSGTYTRRWYVFTTNADQPPLPPTITGPAQGRKNVDTKYNITTTDPDNDHVYYFIDWGDNTNTSWIGDYASGQVVMKSHTWTKKGTYIIKAKAKDLYGLESNWSTLTIKMPLSYEPPHLRLLDWLFAWFPHAFPILRHLLGS